MSWPLSQDYNEAIQSPAGNFTDADLKRGEAVCNSLGLPIPYSGNFADVYQVRCPDGSRWAVKCFTREAVGLRERYQEISAHLNQVKLPFTVDFTYLEKGIRAAGEWHPVLKMQWVEGLTLNQFVGKHLDKPGKLESLYQIWTRMAIRLRAAQVAHGDLQHGNILLVPGANSLALKLIDYDGMWVPALAKIKSGEVGHGNYQHPQRLRDGIYNAEVDRFPLLLIATALRALTIKGKALWDKYDNGDNLLFKEADLLAPLKSLLFLDLTKLADPAAESLVGCLVKALRQGLDFAPLLEELMAEPLPAPTSPPKRPSLFAPTAAPVILKAVPVAPVRPVAAGAFDFGEPAPMVGRFKKWPFRAVAAACVLLAGLAILWAGGVFKVRTADGILVVRVNEPNAEVFVDGDRMTVSWNDGGNTAEIHVKPGTRKVEVKKDGFSVSAKELTFKDGGREIFTARLLPDEPRVANADQSPAAETALLETREKPTDITNSNGMKLKLIQPGTFQMGSPQGEPGAYYDEHPQHTVEITRPFYLGVYPVTQAEYVRVTGLANPSWFSKENGGKSAVEGLDTSRFPVETVSGDEAAAFCEVLNRLDKKKLAGWKYALPTEAEWEYACRAGTTTAYSFGDDAKMLGDYAWYTDNSGNHTHPVGGKKPNPWGLYDMHGNVWQWCAGYGDAKYYENSDKKDPLNSNKSNRRGLRGGSWSSVPRLSRSAGRYVYVPASRNVDYGFRVVLRVPG